MSTNIFYVYLLLDPRKFYQPFYVGKGYGKRVYNSLRIGGQNPLKSRVISRIRKSGSKPEFLIWKSDLSENEAFELESELIKRFGRRDKKTGILTNLTDGGEGVVGRIFSEKQLQNIRKRMSGEKNPMYGRNHSEDSRKQMQLSQKARCEAGLVTKHSEEHKNKLKIDNPGGKATAVPIHQISIDGNVIKTWPSANIAAKELNISKGNICNFSKDNSIRLCGGFWWRLTTSKEVNNGKLINVDELNKKRLRPKITKKLIQKSLDGYVIRTWDSFQEAINHYNFGYDALWASVKYKRVYKDFMWERG